MDKHGGVSSSRIITNSIKFHFLEPKDRFKYAITFAPELPSPKRRALLLQQFHEILGKQYLFDDLRNALYLPCNIGTILPEVAIDAKAFVIIGRMPYSEKIDVRVTFRPVSLPDPCPFLTILVRRGFELLGFERYGDGFYETVVELPEHKVQIQSGIRFGTRENENGVLMLWLEPSCLVWRRETVLDALSSFDNVKDRISAFDEYIKSRFIFTPTRTQFYYRVDEVRWDLNPLSTFQHNGNELTFADYYLLHYGIDIKNMTQPLLLTKCRISAESTDQIFQCRDPMIVGPTGNLMVHIPELCRMSGLRMQCKQWNSRSMEKDIGKYVSISPRQMVTTMSSYLKCLHSSKVVTRLFDDWGIKLDSSFVQVDGSVLAGPKIKMNQSTTLNFDNIDTFLSAHCDLKKLAGSVPVYASEPLLHWILVCTAADENLGLKFRDAFTNEIATLKLEHPGVRSVHKTFLVTCENKCLADKFVDVIRTTGTEPQLVVFIVPRGNDGGVYAAVKKYCCLELGIVSQGIRAKSICANGFPGIVRRVALQICSKLGGAPWALDVGVSEERVMTVGIDTYHDRAKKTPSVMALVFTLNSQCTKYFTRTVQQKIGVEVGNTLGPIFFEAYIEFYKECRGWPSKVIVFRDGVSNAYFELIRAHEVAQIRRSMEPFSVPPKLIFVVVQKHSTDRFMLFHGERVLNLIPGTVVDNTVTRTDYKDFFLFSQMFRGVGTGQPTRCAILEDDTDDFSFVKSATYASSFTYFNWSGSVRIPAVCQYAHKAAGFVGVTLRKNPLPCMENKLYYL